VLGVDPQWIVKRTGVESRRRSDDDSSLARLAADAALAALADASLSPDAVELVLVGTSSSDYA